MPDKVIPGVITITCSPGKGGKAKTWWWISGDTKPKKDILSKNGARFSKRRTAWYYIGEHLPDAIRTLENPKSGAVPAIVQDAQRLLEQMFEEAARHDPVELAREAAKHVIAKLEIIQYSAFNRTKGYRWTITGSPTEAEKVVLDRWCVTYSENEWRYFYEELPSPVQTIARIEYPENISPPVTTGRQPPKAKSVEQTYSGQFHAKLHTVKDREYPGSTSYCWIIRGEPSDFERTVLNQYCSTGGFKNMWRYLEKELPDALRKFVHIDAENNTNPPGQTATPEGASRDDSVETPDAIARADSTPVLDPIRIIKPQRPTEGTESDAVQAAIAHLAQTKSVVVPTVFTNPTTPTRTKHSTPIGQKFVGELTGNISGNVLCFGYGIHEGVTVYVNMGGPRMAVEAIRAKLSKGEVVNLTPWDGPAIELTAGEKNTGKYKDFFANMPEAKFTSLILVHEMLIEPNYGGKSTTFIIRTSDEQAIAKLKHHITELVKTPVFDTWSNYLWQAGQAAMLVRRTRSGGDIDLWTITLDIDAWTRLLTGGLDQAVIALPQ